MATTELPVLTRSQSRSLLRLTAQRVRAAVRREKWGQTLPAEISEIPLFGVFVSLKGKSNNQLRSCMGTLRESEPLGRLLEQAAVLAATSDPRFPPLQATELASLRMEVWLLACPRPMLATGRDRIAAVEVGKHGLIAIRGSRHGLLLPGVPVEFGWNAQTFLEHTCIKAGLPPDAWRDDTTQFEIFEGVEFADLLATLLAESDTPTPNSSSRDSMNAQFERLGFGEVVVSPEIAPTSPMVRTPVRVRRAAVAGKFYPSGHQMGELLDHFFRDAEQSTETLRSQLLPGPIVGAMVPHAGWIFSGAMAVRTLAILQERSPIPRRWLILCPKHTPGGAAWAVSQDDEWEIPGPDGHAVRIPADPDFANRFISSDPGFVSDSRPHEREHAIEVLLPMIYRLSPHCRMTAVTMSGGDDWATLAMAAQRIADLWASLPEQDRPFILISSDMSHYIPAAKARQLDGEVLKLLEQRQIRAAYQRIQRERITMCGAEPACLMLESLRLAGQLRQIVCTGYTHSGMVTGDSSEVVGYAGLFVQ